jgi:XTP/dITP diphosphohydrolase
VSALTQTLVVATGNRNKLVEIRALLGGLPLRVVSMEDVLRPAPTIVEDGATFADNASKKAKAVAAASLCLVLADDSGLEVDALDGRPGVRSARFAGDRATDAENNAALLAALQATHPAADIADADSYPARFRCVFALVDPYSKNSDVALAEGVCEGAITRSARGSFGFGYDPLFVVAGQDKTMAELTEDEKNQVSHRARAFQALRPVLSRILAEREALVREVG